MARMKSFAMLAVLLLTSTCAAQSARSYFEGLYKSGGLDRMADEYVCFDDNPSIQTFFIFTTSKTLRELFIAKGEFAKLPKAQRDELNSGFLILRGYDEGVPEPHEDTFSPDGSSWVEKGVFNKVPVSIRFTISWETMRYKRSIETTLRSESAEYGHCERTPTGVRQKEH
jgi:hypothetical protein